MKGFREKILGCLPQALMGNVLIGGAALMLGILLDGPKMYLELQTALAAFVVLLILYFALTVWSVSVFSKNNELITEGPYKYVRHPMYSAVIFLLNPALAILFRSWLLLLACILVYFIWRAALKSEERMLVQKFGDQFIEYRKKTPAFFPDLYSFNKLAFYSLVGLSVFAALFIFLNFSALYQRWVIWEGSGGITYDDPGKKTPSFSPSVSPGQSSGSYLPSYNPSSDSIVIPKININAPLIQATGSTQKELNAALNQGVIIYPGSAMPGQNGEVFLSGHSSIYPWVKTQYGQVFALLDKLEKGDVVSLVFNNRQHDYRITGKQVLNANQVKIQSGYEPKLTLMTCWPIGTSLKRLVVTGELIK